MVCRDASADFFDGCSGCGGDHMNIVPGRHQPICQPPDHRLRPALAFGRDAIIEEDDPHRTGAPVGWVWRRKAELPLVRVRAGLGRRASVGAFINCWQGDPKTRTSGFGKLSTDTSTLRFDQLFYNPQAQTRS